jgi:TATA-binding protein-associated factor Taf7
MFCTIQMLIVGEQIKSEEQIVKGKLHPEELAWPDGLTPPLKNVRKERWRKKIDLGVSNFCDLQKTMSDIVVLRAMLPWSMRWRD